jgi:hypothetical protein
MEGEAMALALRRRRTALAIVICLFAAALALPGSKANASNVQFCWGVVVTAEGGASPNCHESTFRKITRVNVSVNLFSACASAINGNGVHGIGGYVCTPQIQEATASNTNYNGSTFLQGLVTNNTDAQNQLFGQEWYNP